jgi:hypothetical protein
MKLSGFSFAVTNWEDIESSTRAGTTGVARSRTRQIGELRFRLVEYSPD